MPVKKKTELEQLISDIHSYNLNYHTREIYLHSAFGGCCDDDESGVEYKMATAFIKNLHLLAGQTVEMPIVVHMHTVGGTWHDGMAIFNTIRFLPVPVTMIAYAQASSMSGVLLQAADCRVIAPDCEFMIHHGSIAVADNSMAAKAAIDSNEKACKRMLEIFARRAKTGRFFKENGYNESKIKTYLDRKIKDKSDWYLTAEEAVYYGFADGILGEEGYETLENLKIIEKFKGKI
jgi:ATP-dependent Clp protease protease subunit